MAPQTSAHSPAPTVSVPPPSPNQPDSVGFETLWFAAWTIAAVVIAKLIGVFRQKSIHGPERLGSDESVWWLMMILCAGALIGGKLSALFRQIDFNLPSDGRSLLMSGIGEVLVFASIIVLSLFVRRDSIRLMGLRLLKLPIGIAGGVITLLLLFPMVCLTETLVTEVYLHFHLKQASPHELLQLMNSTDNHRVVVIAFITAAVVAPLLEELIFRGMIQTMLGRMFSFAFGTPVTVATRLAPAVTQLAAVPATADSKVVLEYQPPPNSPADAPPTGSRARWAAVVMTSALFAAIHVEPAFMPPIFVLSLGLGYVYERTGNLWMNITAHSLFNSVQILFFFFFH